MGLWDYFRSFYYMLDKRKDRRLWATGRVLNAIELCHQLGFQAQPLDGPVWRTGDRANCYDQLLGGSKLVAPTS